MDDDAALHFDVKFIVARLVAWPRYRKGMDDQTSSSIASEIIKHLKLSNWRFRKGPPTPCHSTTTGHRDQ
jgi:hypothetical protein